MSHGTRSTRKFTGKNRKNHVLGPLSPRQAFSIPCRCSPLVEPYPWLVLKGTPATAVETAVVSVLSHANGRGKLRGMVMASLSPVIPRLPEPDCAPTRNADTYDKTGNLPRLLLGREIGGRSWCDLEGARSGWLDRRARKRKID